MAALDTSDTASTVQLQVYRRMSPAARLRVGLELTAMSRQLVMDGVRRRHPEYTEEETRLAFLRLWLGPRLYREAYPGNPELLP